jgi:hypothetical protein
MLITASTTGSTKTAFFKCATVQSEGGTLSSFGFNFSTPETTATAGNGVRVPILSVRPKTTFNGIVNRELFILENINLFVTGNIDVFWELVIGGTYGGQVFSDINTAFSAFEYSSTPGTFSNLTGGIVLASGYMSRLGGTNNGNPIITPAIQSLHYPISLNRAGSVRALGTITLLVTGINQVSACRASMNFREIR